MEIKMFYNEYTKKPYTGKNVEILASTGLKGGFMTFKQALSLGYSIPKGTKTVAKLIRPMMETVEDKNGKEEVMRSGRTFHVFHTSQLEQSA
tara:strand:+ start:45 stop:320 length:276 start_codon:yes stop_codon:yes gene_type:complete